MITPICCEGKNSVMPSIGIVTTNSMLLCDVDDDGTNELLVGHDSMLSICGLNSSSQQFTVNVCASHATLTHVTAAKLNLTTMFVFAFDSIGHMHILSCRTREQLKSGNMFLRPELKLFNAVADPFPIADSTPFGVYVKAFNELTPFESNHTTSDSIFIYVAMSSRSLRCICVSLSAPQVIQFLLLRCAFAERQTS